MNLTEQVKARARALGADLVGVAPVERFAGAPLRMSPKGLLPGARCVVVCGIHHLDAAVELGGQPTPHDLGPYGSQSAMNCHLDDVSFGVARLLEAHGRKALPVAATNIWRYHAYKDLEVDFAPDLAHRYAAVAAGLGEIGWSGLVLTPEFGPRCRFVSVVTDAPLDPSPMYDGPPLCDKCLACVETCPTDAFRKEVARINEIEIGGRTFRFPETNKWRCAWAENFCLDLAHRIPEHVDEAVILTYLEKYGMRGGEEGCCLQFCMNPQNRTCDKSHPSSVAGLLRRTGCRPPRRKKKITERDPKKLLATVERLLAASGADVWATGSVRTFGRKRGQDPFACRPGGCFAQKGPDPFFHPKLHLPDAETLLSIGFRIPPACAESADVRKVMRRKMQYAAFDVAHHLDLAGYSAVPGTPLLDGRVAEVLGIYGTDLEFTTVLTSAKLPSVRRRRRKTKAPADADAVRRFCRKAGADLVGFFTVGRFEALRSALEKSDLPLGTTEVVEDAGMIYGPFVPRVRRKKGVRYFLPVGPEGALHKKYLTPFFQGPEDWLPGAKSVIVLGLHFPDDALDTAKVTPAETVGPFTFVRCEAQLLLGDIAFKVVQRLNDAGRGATLTHDLTGLASQVHSSRGMLPDMRSNRFAAALAGLAHIGVNGMPITAEFGTRQLFVAIVTDMELPDDPLYAGAVACETCDKPCIAACPTSAITRKVVPLKLDGTTVDLPVIDRFACDWAARYCLAGEEGPRYCGLDVDMPLPKERSAHAVASALSKTNWGVQKRHTNIVEECLRACPERGRGVCPARDSKERRSGP